MTRTSRGPEAAERPEEDAPAIAVNGVFPNTESPETKEASPDGEIPKMSEISAIRYVGMADVKILLTEDLVAMGVENPKGDLEWNQANGRRVSSDFFNAATRDALLANPNFLAE